MKFNGTLLKMFVVGTPNKEIADTRYISVTITIADIDVTTRDSGGWTEVLGGVRGWTGKATGVLDWATESGKIRMRELIDYGIARVTVNTLFSTAVTGDSALTGNALYTNVTFSAPHEGEVTWSADLKGNGAIVPATVV